jgi:hypothetical protein
MVIELVRDIEQNKPRTEKRYDFDRIKANLNQYDNAEDKLLYLMEKKTEYLQNKPLYINPSEMPFNEKVDLEIILVKKQNQVKRKRDASALKRIDKTISSSKTKAKINTNINQFVDVFFQMLHEKVVDDKPFLDANPNTLAGLIADNFVDKDGKDIPLETIKTILKPSRFEKRPKGSMRINLLN